MTLNRLLTTIIQLAFGIPTFWYAKEAYKDIKENGFIKPIIVNEQYAVIDGDTRLAIAKELGYKSVIVRKL